MHLFGTSPLITSLINHFNLAKGTKYALLLQMQIINYILRSWYFFTVCSANIIVYERPLAACL